MFFYHVLYTFIGSTLNIGGGGGGGAAAPCPLFLLHCMHCRCDCGFAKYVAKLAHILIGHYVARPSLYK